MEMQMKAIKGITLIMVCISAVYLAVSSMLSLTELSFRTWVKVSGQMIVGIFTPIMLLVLALFFLYNKECVRQAVKIACIAAAVIVCSIYVCVAVFFILLGSQEERMLTRHLLVTNEAFLDEIKPVYYRPAAFFFKRPGELTADDQVEYLEKKYRRTFGVYEPEGGIYDQGFPEVKVSVRLAGMSLADNYVEKLTFAGLLEAYRALGVERNYHIVEERHGLTYLCLEASGYDDIPALSKDISRLYQYVLSGRLPGDAAAVYREHTGEIYYSFGKNEKGYTGAIRFGGMDGEVVIDVEELVRTAYRQYGTEAPESAQDSPERTVGDSGAETIPPTSEPELEPDDREVAAKMVYDAALAEEGFSYEVYYNAKGNLYIDLGTKASGEDGRVYSYELVYDRSSRNGACELFVLYRSVEGSDDQEIVDMYAVETATGKVVASGRKAWSDVGTKEYREMTGE